MKDVLRCSFENENIVIFFAKGKGDPETAKCSGDELLHTLFDELLTNEEGMPNASSKKTP